MKRIFALALLGLGLLGISGLAAAQDVTCESVQNRQTECPMNTSGEVRMVQQLSKTACTEGTTWGLFKHSVWVSGGCRATFRNMSMSHDRSPGYGAGRHNDLPTSVVCESSNSQQVSCEMNTSGHVRVSRQLSKAACIEDQTWGLTKHTVWVSDGCRAEFVLDNRAIPAAGPSAGYGNGHVAGLPTHVTCASEGGQQTDCEMNTSGVVRMETQLSRAACVEGQTWGLNKHSVWVSGGCRATFVNGGQNRGDGQGGRRAPTSSQIAACNAKLDRYGQVESATPLRPGAFEIILAYSDGRYACDVGADNRVDGFQKLD